NSPVVRTAIITTEVHAAGQAGCSQKPAEFILVAPLPKLFFANESSFVPRLCLAFLPREHFLRAEELYGLTVYRVVQGHGPKHIFALLLTTCPQFQSECLEGR